MNIVFFHVDHGDHVYYQLAELAVDAARRLHPEARLVHLTDASSAALKGVHGAIRANNAVPREWANVVRIKLMADALTVLDGPTLFIEPDVLLCERWPEMESACALYVTARPEPKIMPYNFGVIYARLPQAAGFLHYLSKVAASYPAPCWYVDQLALAVALGYPSSIDDSNLHRIQHAPTGTKVGVLSCNKFNYSPEGRDEELRPVMHFKGPRKPLMQGYYERCIALA